MTDKDTITTTIRIPRALWIKLRRLQEKGEIQSIQWASIRGLERIAFERGSPKEGGG